MMIISERQIMQLWDIARMCGQILIAIDAELHKDKINQIADLLEKLREQQSAELKTIE